MRSQCLESTRISPNASTNVLGFFCCIRHICYLSLHNFEVNGNAPQVDKPLMTSLMTQSWNEYNGTNAAAVTDEKPGKFGKCVESTSFSSDAVKPAAFRLSL